jgi:hypothetical protein
MARSLVAGQRENTLGSSTPSPGLVGATTRRFNTTWGRGLLSRSDLTRKSTTKSCLNVKVKTVG